MRCTSCNDKIVPNAQYCKSCGTINEQFDEDSSASNGIKFPLTILALAALASAAFIAYSKNMLTIPFITEKQPSLQISTRRISELQECVYVLNTGEDTIKIDSIQLNNEKRSACYLDCVLAMGNSVQFPNEIAQGIFGSMGLFMRPQNWIKLTLDISGKRYEYQLK